jgi:hypothetical protein
MPFKVETGLLNPDTAQYAGKGQAKPTIADVAAAAKRIEALGFDGVCTPEAGTIRSSRSRSPPSTPRRSGSAPTSRSRFRGAPW